MPQEVSKQVLEPVAGWRPWLVGARGWLAPVAGWRPWLAGARGWLAPVAGWRPWLAGARGLLAPVAGWRPWLAGARGWRLFWRLGKDRVCLRRGVRRDQQCSRRGVHPRAQGRHSLYERDSSSRVPGTGGLHAPSDEDGFRTLHRSLLSCHSHGHGT